MDWKDKLAARTAPVLLIIIALVALTAAGIIGKMVTVADTATNRPTPAIATK